MNLATLSMHGTPLFAASTHEGGQRPCARTTHLDEGQRRAHALEAHAGRQRQFTAPHIIITHDDGQGCRALVHILKELGVGRLSTGKAQGDMAAWSCCSQLGKVAGVTAVLWTRIVAQQECTTGLLRRVLFVSSVWPTVLWLEARQSNRVRDWSRACG